jgi:hypothetical protein
MSIARPTILTVLLVAGGSLVAPASADELLQEGFETGSGLCAWATGQTHVFTESFSGTDGSGWPTGWQAAGNGVALADLLGGRGRARPVASSYALARLAANPTTRDVEVTFTLTFEDVTTQGVGFYVRQNGGYLQQTMPHGQGYAVFVEGFRGPRIGVWKEEDGQEIELAFRADAALGYANGTPFRVRLRVQQSGPGSTHLQARVWPAAAAEPAAWDVDTIDATAVLQGITGGIGVDSWSTHTAPPLTAHTLVDDILVCGL